MEAYGSFAEVYDLFMDNVPYDLWNERLLHILRENGICDGLVAELGCGTGKMTRRLAKAGYDMIGIDASPEMLAIAMETDGEDTAPGIGPILYLNQDMREFELYGTVAAVISICDSMNYLTEEEDLRKVFSLVNNYLDPGGIFIFDLNTRYKYEQILGEQVIAENRPQGSFIWENHFDVGTGINQYDLTLYIRRENHMYERCEETHLQRCYETETIRKLVEAAGMRCEKILDAETMGSVTDSSERIYVVAREQGKQRRKNG